MGLARLLGLPPTWSPPGRWQRQFAKSQVLSRPGAHAHRRRRESFTLVELGCGCQDVHFACGFVDYEHDHVECDGEAGG